MAGYSFDPAVAAMTVSPTVEGWTRVAELSDFLTDARIVRQVEGVEVLLCDTAQGVQAMLNRCPHLCKPLHRGLIRQGKLTCPFHGACFDLASGAPVSGPAERPLHLFPVRIADGAVWVDLSRRPQLPW